MYESLLLPDLREMLREGDTKGLAEFCETCHPSFVADVLEGAAPEEAVKVILTCTMEHRREIFSFLPLPTQVELVDGMKRDDLAALLEEMPPDDRVDLLERLDPDHVESLLPLIAQAERNDIRKLLSYPEDSAGSIMTTDYASLPANITVREALDQLRLQAPDKETIYYIYILDAERRLSGFVSLRNLTLSKPDAKLSDIMRRDVISVNVSDDQEFVASEISRYDFLAIPVVDADARLVGIVTHDDASDVQRDEATEDAQRLGAVEPLEDSYLTTTIIELAKKRGIWLVILLGASLLTAGVLDWFVTNWLKSESSQGWIMLFIPLVMASGGNAGAQSATLIIRARALKEIDLSKADIIKVFSRELILGLLLGLSIAVLSFLSALFLVTPQQALVVAITVFLIVVMATMTGSLLPLLLDYLGADPALMSNPLIAALVDVVGVIIYFSVARLIIGDLSIIV